MQFRVVVLVFVPLAGAWGQGQECGQKFGHHCPPSCQQKQQLWEWFSPHLEASALTITKVFDAVIDGARAGLGTSWCQQGQGWLGFPEPRETSLVGKRKTGRWEVWHLQDWAVLLQECGFTNQLWEEVGVLLDVRAVQGQCSRCDAAQGVLAEINLPLLLSPAVFWFPLAGWCRVREVSSVGMFPVHHVNGSRGSGVECELCVWGFHTDPGTEGLLMLNWERAAPWKSLSAPGTGVHVTCCSLRPGQGHTGCTCITSPPWLCLRWFRPCLLCPSQGTVWAAALH